MVPGTHHPLRDFEEHRLTKTVAALRSIHLMHLELTFTKSIIPAV